MEQDDPKPRTFTVSAWRNGSPSPSGAGYGLKVKSKDRDTFFVREWGSIILHFDKDDDLNPCEVNIDKNSMWHGNCRELIHHKIGKWLKRHNLAPWETHDNPKNIVIEHIDGRDFRVLRPQTRIGIPGLER